MVERDGSFSWVGVVEELGDGEEGLEGRDCGEERWGSGEGRRTGAWYGEEDESWYTMEGRMVRSWWRLICSVKEASEEESVARPQKVEELSEREI